MSCAAFVRQRNLRGGLDGRGCDLLFTRKERIPGAAGDAEVAEIQRGGLRRRRVMPRDNGAQQRGDSWIVRRMHRGGFCSGNGIMGAGRREPVERLRLWVMSHRFESIGSVE